MVGLQVNGGQNAVGGKVRSLEDEEGGCCHSNVSLPGSRGLCGRRRWLS